MPQIVTAELAKPAAPTENPCHWSGERNDSSAERGPGKRCRVIGK